MERQGFFRGFQIVSGYSYVWVVLAVLLLSVSGWAACTPASYEWSGGNRDQSCNYGPTCTFGPGNYPSCKSLVCNVSNCPQNVSTGWGTFYAPAESQSEMCQNGGSSCTHTSPYSINCLYTLKCDSKRDADSAICVQAGRPWNSSEGRCEEPCPESVCDEYKDWCEQKLQGKFTGSCVRSGEGGSACCHGYCNVCSGPAMTVNYNEMKDICCNKRLMAPPKIADVCLDNPPLQGGCGVYQSTFRTNGENWACHDPNQSQEMMDRYTQECYGESSSSGEGGGSSSSGGGGSSSDAMSSAGSPYPEGCDECPWLDSILDTLTAQKKAVDDIKACILYPGLCNEDGEVMQIDTSLLPYLRPFMDSTLKLDSNQLKALRDLDTNLLKMLANDTNLFKIDSTILKIDSAMLKMDSAMLKSDSATRKAIAGGVGTLDSTIDASSDSTKKWLRRLIDSSSVHSDSNMKYLKAVADSIGITADSLKAHLDSIMNRIPSDILDSILKYQKENAEKEDSVVIGSLDQLDSILDSTIVYWKKSQSADSARHAERNDSTEAIHKAIDDIAGRISEIIGYGDTATGDLRGDIKGVGDAVSDMRDSALKYWRQSQSADSAYRMQFGGAIETINGTTGAIVIRQDTTNAKLGAIGDKIGVLTDSMAKYFGGGGVVDSSGIRGRWADSVVKYMVTDADYRRLYDSTEAAWGVGAIDSSWDSSYAFGRCQGNDCPPCSDDSCMGTFDPSRMLHVGDSLIVASGMGDALQQSVQQQRDSLPTQWDSAYAALKEVSFFKSFDSTFLANIGAKIPNTNTCPEDCFRQDINGKYAYTDYNLSLDWKLCAPVAPNYLNGLNAFDIIKLLARILTVVTCMTIIMWEVSSRRGGIGL